MRGILRRLVASSVVMLTPVLLTGPASAQDDFRQWMQQQQRGVTQQLKEFQEYKDARDKEFTAFLKAQWKPVDIVTGEVLDQVPKPVVMPVAPAEEQPVTGSPPAKPPVIQKPVTSEPVVGQPLSKKPGVDAPATEPIAKPTPGPTVVTVPRPEPVAKPVVVPPARQPGKEISVDFYGRKLRFIYDARLRQRLPHNINKDSISDYWSALSRSDYDGLLSQLQAQRDSLRLNDWAYATLIDRVAKKVATGRENETAVLSWFLLAKSGYKARIAYRSNRVFLLVPSEHELFEVSYFTFSGKRFYAVDFAGDKLDTGRVFTYDGEYPGTDREFDMRVDSVVASSELPETRKLAFEYKGKPYQVEVIYDRGRVGFFSQYPQLSLDLYFASGVYNETATPLLQQLASHMQGMDELTAVNFLLRFVQTSFEYATDEQQFGEENYLFPEETLFYPYSDCEDRAVLFAWLVSNLLQLEVVGLDYPGHVAAAVNFTDAVQGDAVEFQGRRYVVTDPTYINAVAGMTMPDFKAYKPRLIRYQPD